MHLLYLTANQKIFLLLLTYVHACVCVRTSPGALRDRGVESLELQ